MATTPASQGRRIDDILWLRVGGGVLIEIKVKAYVSSQAKHVLANKKNKFEQQI